MKKNSVSRILRRQGTKTQGHKECQTKTKGAARRARKTLPEFYQVDQYLPVLESES